LAFVNKLRAYAPKNPPSVSRQSADDFPQIRFSREVSAFAMDETVTVPLSRQAGQKRRTRLFGTEFNAGPPESVRVLLGFRN
jgi:hypothetical protein